MSTEAAQSFMKLVNADAGLKAQVKGLQGSESLVVAEIVKLGAAKNLSFTGDELKAVARESQGKLSKQDLDLVAGGGCTVVLLTVGACTG